MRKIVADDEFGALRAIGVDAHLVGRRLHLEWHGATLHAAEMEPALDLVGRPRQDFAAFETGQEDRRLIHPQHQAGPDLFPRQGRNEGVEGIVDLDEVLETPLCATPTPVLPGLFALNIDPEAAAAAYRERMVGPYRGILPDAAIRSMEEQFSGGCTVEIAAFDAFAELLGLPARTADFDHVIFDTAPTGHTLRLLTLPAAWSEFLDSGAGGASCLGPLAGLDKQKSLYAATVAELADQARSKGDNKEARKLIADAYSADNQSVRAGMLEAQIELSENDDAGAIRAFERVVRHDYEYLPEVLPALLASYERKGETTRARSFLLEMTEHYAGVSPLLALSELIQKDEGVTAAYSFLAKQLQQRPSVRGEAALINLSLSEGHGDPQEALRTVKSITDLLVVHTPGYRCQRCGFSARAHHWQCPSCKNWGTIKPLLTSAS